MLHSTYNSSQIHLTYLNNISSESSQRITIQQDRLQIRHQTHYIREPV